jgi:hypothetical protein
VQGRADKNDPTTWNHGSASTYNNLKCRCEPCKEAASIARKVWTDSLKDRKFSDVPHGTVSGYKNWGCRCDRCTLVNSRHERYRRTQAKMNRNEENGNERNGKADATEPQPVDTA